MSHAPSARPRKQSSENNYGWGRSPDSMHRRTCRNLFSICLMLLWLNALGTSGCAFSRGDLGTPLDPNRTSDIKKGRTTEAQVIALLGAPDSIQEINHQEVFHYYRYMLKHGTVLVFSRVNIASDDLYIFFDQDGVVQQVVYGDRTNNLKFQFWPFGHTEGD
jgi:outer membrane protein assembly factor BamE (lipoprotein component of BamABCDE complex)